MRRVKKDLKYYRKEVRELKKEIKRLENRVGDLVNLRALDNKEIGTLKGKINSNRILGGERLVTQIQQSLTAQAHALEAIAKIAQPGVF